MSTFNNNNNFKQHAQKDFTEDPNCAVFLTGLKAIHNHREYMLYRNKVYNHIKDDLGLYIRKFDFPKGKSNAYLHLKTANQTDYLLYKKKILTIEGKRISIYRYQKSMARKYQESRNESLASSYHGSNVSTRPETPNNEPLIRISNFTKNNFEESTTTGYNSQANYNDLYNDENSKQSSYKNIKHLAETQDFIQGMNVIKQISIKQNLNSSSSSINTNELSLPVLNNAPENAIEISENDSSDNDSLLNSNFNRQDTIKASDNVTDKNDEADMDKAYSALLENAEYIYKLIKPYLYDMSWCSNAKETTDIIKNEAIKIAMTKITSQGTIPETDLIEIINSLNNGILQIIIGSGQLSISSYSDEMAPASVY